MTRSTTMFSLRLMWDTSRLRFFHFSLMGKAKEWLNKIPPTQITTWDQLVAWFLDYFFPVGCASFLCDMILLFKQGNNKTIKSTWIHFQDLIKQVPHHGIQKWLLVQIFHDNISQKDQGKLDQFAHFHFSSLTEEEGWNQIEEYVQYQDDLCDDPSPPMNISSISGVIQPTFKGRLKRACMQISLLEAPHREIRLRNPYLICDFSRVSHEADKCDQNNPTEQVCLYGGDIYDDPSLLRFYQNDDVPPWGNNQQKKVGESGPNWVVRSKTVRKEGPKGAESSIIRDEEAPRSSVFYQTSKSSNLPFPFRVRKQKRDDEDEQLLSIFKQIHINLPFLEVMIHMPKGAKVLKDLLSHKEKLVKAASSVKLSEECSTIIQRSLPQKRRRSRKFHTTVSNQTFSNKLADLGASINLMPHYLFRRLGISKLKPTRMSIQLANRSIKYPIKPVEPLKWKTSENRLKPSSVEPPELELKELPKHLEYAFLRENNKLLVVISSALSAIEKARLLEVLKNHKGAIAWSITDIKGIDSSFCTHKILMEDEFKPSVQPQRWVKSNIKEVVKKEVIKLLNVGLIYPISDSPWVSPVQMLERLAGHEYYCFLDGFSGYFQIPIALEDQEKTAFTCPYGTFAYK
ncbi:reverse transcriptase domain-containing protein [Tanacetum coccineum]